MAGMVVQEIAKGNKEVEIDAKRIMGITRNLSSSPSSPHTTTSSFPSPSQHILTNPTINILTSDSTKIINKSQIFLEVEKKVEKKVEEELVVNITTEELCTAVLHTVYMGTSNSSAATKSRSLRLAQAIGSYHNTINIDAIVSAVLHVFTSMASVCSSSSNSNVNSNLGNEVT